MHKLQGAARLTEMPRDAQGSWWEQLMGVARVPLMTAALELGADK